MNAKAIKYQYDRRPILPELPLKSELVMLFRLGPHAIREA